MSRFRVDVKEPARKQLERLSPPVARRILAAVEALAENPYPRGDTIKRLKGHTALYRLRVGSWRVVYELELAGDTLAVLYVGNRSEIYKRGGF